MRDAGRGFCPAVIAARRALLLLPTLAACYGHLPPPAVASARPEALEEERGAPCDGACGEPPAAAAPILAAPSVGADAILAGGGAPEAGPPGAAAAAPPDAGEGGGPIPPPEEETSGVRLRIVEIARRFVGHRFAGDCSGYVRRVLRDADVDLGPLPPSRSGSMSESLHLASRPVERPRPGDLVFFHDTYDRNRNGRLDDPWSHVALVEGVEGETVWILHRSGSGITRIRMDLAHPHDEAVNDPVRLHGRRDPRGTQYLSGELFSGYGAVVE